MKKTLFTILATLSTSLLAGVPSIKQVPIDHLYIPAGFDSNDNTEVIITGFLPNLCHKNPTAKINIDENKNINIKVTSLYYDKSNPFCPQMIVPFTLPVSLGVVQPGQYKVIVNNDKQKSAKLKVQESTSSAIDNYHYAYVSNVLTTPGSNKIQLKGYNPSDCFVLDKIESISNKKDTFSILPKMKQVNEFCPMKMVPFTYEFEVPETLPKNNILLHVRKMDGKSVNTILIQ
ncbi:MAG: hypothetical protein N4A33_07835 [Bacteriovoracaceae bacterium]|jgi:hypothetical protein|nr:hypothetical protein [Bacteriovoracaceae bacterium]